MIPPGSAVEGGSTLTDWRLERDRALFQIEHEKRPDVRAEAAFHLCELASVVERAAELAPAVALLLADGQDEVRCAGVALAAMTLPGEKARPILVRHLADPAVRVRVEAAGQLADLAEPTTRGALAEAMQDESFAVRFEAACGMAALKHSAGLEVLIEALDHVELRFRALGALAELGNPDAVPAVKRLFKRWLLPAFDRTQAAGVLARFGDPDGIAYLHKRTRRRWGLDRPMAVELLGEVKAPGAFERLVEILDDPSDRSRGAAARGLGRLGDSRATERLAKWLDDGSTTDELLLDLAEGLCLLGTAEARGHVERLAAAAAGELRAELKSLLSDFASGERAAGAQ